MCDGILRLLYYIITKYMSATNVDYAYCPEYLQFKLFQNDVVNIYLVNIFICEL